jgi:hypothetical protein
MISLREEAGIRGFWILDFGFWIDDQGVKGGANFPPLVFLSPGLILV